jgi:tRNA/tmRNA/rRNA uracil-C5-methylase (TrmA/RlmC/RlmD family)
VLLSTKCHNLECLQLLIHHMEDIIVAANCKNLLDVYCGVGLFSICFAKHFQNVTGIEGDVTISV